MAYRSVIIESPASLRVQYGQLVINTEREYTVPVEDISALLLESRQSTITTAALSILGKSGCAVFVCDEKHIPCAVLTPYAQHSRHLEVIREQLAIPEPLKKRLWQSLVRSKIENQASCLQYAGKADEANALMQLAAAVRSGDVNNTEATAAAKYFPALFYKGFARGSENVYNAALNYGYAILRGVIARNVAVYGFLPAVGLHHRSTLNPFNLADDLMEPFRPVIDLVVAVEFKKDSETAQLSVEEKRRMMNCLNMDILSGGFHHSVAYAAERLVQSLSRSLEYGKAELCLPQIIGTSQHAYE